MFDLILLPHPATDFHLKFRMAQLIDQEIWTLPKSLACHTHVTLLANLIEVGKTHYTEARFEKAKETLLAMTRYVDEQAVEPLGQMQAIWLRGLHEAQGLYSYGRYLQLHSTYDAAQEVFQSLKRNMADHRVAQGYADRLISMSEAKVQGHLTVDDVAVIHKLFPWERRGYKIGEGFVVDRPIGSGGDGFVVQVHHKDVPEIVYACKIMACKGDGMARSASREFESLQRAADIPHVVRLVKYIRRDTRVRRMFDSKIRRELQKRRQREQREEEKMQKRARREKAPTQAQESKTLEGESWKDENLGDENPTVEDGTSKDKTVLSGDIVRMLLEDKLWTLKYKPIQEARSGIRKSDPMKLHRQTRSGRRTRENRKYERCTFTNLILEPCAQLGLHQFLRIASESTTQDPPNISWVHRCFTWIHCLSKTLSRLHKLDIYHGDIRAPNILIDGTRIFYADFGNPSADIEDKHRPSIDNEGKRHSFRTTKRWRRRAESDPEKARDIFSLGCVILWMLECTTPPKMYLPVSSERRKLNLDGWEEVRGFSPLAEGLMDIIHNDMITRLGRIKNAARISRRISKVMTCNGFVPNCSVC